MDSHQDKIDEKDREINALKTQIESYEANIDYQEKQIVVVEEDLKTVSQKLTEREVELQNLRNDYKVLEDGYTEISKTCKEFESVNETLKSELNVEKKKTASALSDLDFESKRLKTAQDNLEFQTNNNLGLLQQQKTTATEAKEYQTTIDQLRTEVAAYDACRDELARAQAQNEELQRQFELLRTENDDFRSRPRYVAPEGTAPYQGPATFADELGDRLGSEPSHSQRSSMAFASEIEHDSRSSFDSTYDASPRRYRFPRPQTPPGVLPVGKSSSPGTPPTPLPPKLPTRDSTKVETPNTIIKDIVKTEKDIQIQDVFSGSSVNVYIPVQYVHNNPLSQWFVIERNLIFLLAHLFWYTATPFFRLGLSKTGICTPPTPYQPPQPATDPNHPPEYIRNLLRNNNTIPFVQDNTINGGTPINAAAQAGLQRHITLQPFIPTTLNIDPLDLPNWTWTILGFLIHCQIYYLLCLTGYNLHQRDLWLTANDLTRAAIHELAAKRSGLGYWSLPKSIFGESVGSGYERYLAGLVTTVLKFEPRSLALPG